MQQLSLRYTVDPIRHIVSSCFGCGDAVCNLLPEELAYAMVKGTRSFVKERPFVALTMRISEEGAMQLEGKVGRKYREMVVLVKPR